MCRSTTTDYHQYHPQRSRIKVTAFYLRLCLSSPSADFLPDSLTLLLLPRLTASLHVNGSKVSADSPAFLSLHRVLCSDDKAAVFASKDRLRASDGLSYEVHLAQHRLLKGVLHRDDNTAASWSMECRCDGDIGVGVGVDVREAEVSVALEGGGVVTERVTLVKSRRRRCQRRRFQMDLEDIPEEEYDYESGSSDAASSSPRCGCCCDDFSSSESDGEDELDNGDYNKDVDMDAEMEVEAGAGWAADVGFWAVCLGVGLLVSTASARRLSRRKLLR